MIMDWSDYTFLKNYDAPGFYFHQDTDEIYGGYWEAFDEMIANWESVPLGEFIKFCDLLLHKELKNELRLKFWINATYDRYRFDEDELLRCIYIVRETAMIQKHKLVHGSQLYDQNERADRYRRFKLEWNLSDD